MYGKTILITGATSGLGRALAIMYANNGAKVIAHGRSETLLDSLASSTEGRITGVCADLTREEGWKTVDSVILEKQPNLLILNAGYNCRKDFASGWTDSEVYEMLQVNMIAPILNARTFAGLPKLDKPRRLALILSTSCHYPRDAMGLYVAGKTGLMGFGKVLQQEAKQIGIRTTLFYPGRMNTSFREKPNDLYMHPESVARTIYSVLNLPDDIVPYEFTFRPEVDINI